MNLRLGISLRAFLQELLNVVSTKTLPKSFVRVQSSGNWL